MFLFIRSSALSSVSRQPPSLDSRVSASSAIQSPREQHLNHSLTSEKMMNCIKTKWSKSPDTWFAEASALCISVCALAGIYGLLKHYNGKPVVAWHQVTLNAAVSTLATLARTLMLLAVASCLGQCKWIWFNKQLEPLPDFELINEAARGPSGASRLLLRTILKATLRPKLLTSVVTIGCSVTLLALAFDPTIQQIVSSDQTIFYAKNESTEVPLAHRWSDAYIANTFLGVLNNEFRYWDDIVSGNKAHVKFGTQAAIMTGLTANSDNITQQLRLSCDSGHCRWEKYQSLAVCSRCEEIFHPTLPRETDPRSLIWLLCSETPTACRPLPTLRGIFCHTD